MKAKKLMASAICASMILAISGCAFFDKDDEGVLAAAEDYATAVTKVKVGDIADIISGGDDLKRDIEIYTSGSEVETPDGYSDVVSAIAGTISYEINEDTVESSRKNREGSVDITWTLVDYDAVYEAVSEDGGDLEEFIDALSSNDAATMEIAQTINFVLEDGEWKVLDNNLKSLYMVYDYYSAALNYVFIPPLTDYIEDVEWYFSDNGVYTNYNQIELDLITNDAGSDIPFEFTYEYYINGELVFTSDICEDEGHWIEAYYGPFYDRSAQTNEMGNLIDGEYRCVMYDLAGNVLADETCTVQTTDIGSADGSMISEIQWYFSNNDVYTNETTIELDILPTTEGQDVIWTFVYEYYIDGELVFTSDVCTDQGYWIEAYYGRNYDPAAQVTEDGYLIPGEYTCIIYDLEGNALAESTCTVEVT